tara:strand:- start:753 stop:1037 length:285 start_codon:yes stop_codon:yes gene_type:complete
MSGGSYNYLCYKESYDIHERKEELNKMRDRLIELGFTDAAGETESVLLMLQSFEVRLQTRIDRLKDVWKSVEWMDSGDSGIDRLKDSIKEYRDN